MPTSIDTTTDTLTQLLSHLIRMPTASADHATNRAALDWVQEQLRDLPLSFKHLEHNNYPSLIATTPAVADAKKPKLWLMGHIDVVPGDAGDFNPTVRDGKLYGRGAYDMKYGLAVFIHLLRQLGEDLADYDLGLMITSDEEDGGFDGAGWLASQGYTSRAMILPECGVPWDMESGAKAIARYHLTSSGASGHGARPWEGVNAIDQLMDYLELIKQHFPTEPCRDAKHEHNTLNVGTISGGRAPNQIADYAEAMVDMRLIPATSFATAHAWFTTASATIPSVIATPGVSGVGFETINGDAVKLFRKLVTEVTGRTVTSSLAHASSDARFFATGGTQVITMPPTGGGQHSSAEWVGLEALNQYAEITRQFIEQYAK